MSTIATGTIPYPEPTGLTLAEIALRAGRRFGYTNEQDRSDPGFPLDSQMTDQLKEAVNMGLARFYQDNFRWSFLRVHVSITLDPTGAGPLNINSEPHRYRLPPGVEGSPVDDWTFLDETSDYDKIRTVHFDELRRMYSTSDEITGDPLLAAHTPMRGHGPFRNEADNDSTAWQLMLYPKPQAAHVIEARFRIVPDELTDLDERHAAGAAHDLTVIAAVQYELALMDETRNAGVIQSYALAYQERLAKSITIDSQNVPRRLGMMRKSTGGMNRDDYRQTTYNGVTSVGGINPNP